MGGLIALALAAEYPAEVRGLVLVDPVYAPDGGTHLQGRSARVARLVFAAAFDDRDCRSRAWARQRTQVPVEYPKMIYEAFEGPTHFPNRAFAREIDVPTLLFEPDAPKRPRFPTLVAELERLGDRFTYFVLDGGHYLQLDRSAARLSASVARFVARW